MKDWKHKCELKVLVCQPNPLRPDRVTVGFVLRDTNPDSPHVEVRLADNLRAVRCIYPDADLEAIEGTLTDLSSILKNVTDFESYLRNMPADFPVDLALLPGGAVLTDSMQSEALLLEKQYLPKWKPFAVAGIEKSAEEENGEEGTTPFSDGTGEKKREITAIRSTAHTGRTYLRRKMQEALIHFGAWNFILKDIPVGKYTFKSDPLKIDFAYTDRNTGKYRMLHAVSLVTALDKAKIVAFTWPRIHETVLQTNTNGAELFAITEDERFTQSEQARSAKQWMLNEGINVRPVSQMMAIAQTAREDLKL